jgi:hypothetical protein
MTKIKKLKEKGLNMSALYGVVDKVVIYKAWYGGKKKWIVDLIDLSIYTNDAEYTDFDTLFEAKEYAKHFIK